MCLLALMVSLSGLAAQPIPDQVGVSGGFLSPAQLAQKEPVGVTDLRLTGFSDDDMQLLARFGQLQEVSINHSPRLSDTGVKLLSQLVGLQVVRLLDASFQGQLTDATLSNLVELPTLTTLEIHGQVKIGNSAGALALNKMTNLQYFALRYCAGVSSGFVRTFAANRLVSLSFEGCRTIDDSILESLLAAKSLRQLDISSTSVTGAAVYELVRASTLDVVRCERCDLSIASAVKLQAPNRQSTIRSMSLAWCTKTDSRLLDAIGTIPSLIVIDIRGISEIDTAVFANIAKNPTLQVLRAAQVGIAERDLTVVELSSELRVLDVSGTEISDEGVANIGRRCPKLLDLSLARCSHLTEKCTETISKMPNIRILDVATRVITQASAENLAKISSLSLLIVNDLWSSEAIRSVTDAVPGCVVRDVAVPE